VEIDATIIVVLFFIESHKDTSKMVISVLSLLETREPLMSIKNLKLSALLALNPLFCYAGRFYASFTV
jgi:hypothetical protein